MVNKKGWVRIVEASIAILIIFSVVIAVSGKREAKPEEDLSISITPLLDEIAKNISLRELVVKDSDTSTIAEDALKEFVSRRIISPNIGYGITICNYDQYCGLSSYPGEARGGIYAGSRVITATLNTMPYPKKINIFLWNKA
jgi:hypothetical protein